MFQSQSRLPHLLPPSAYHSVDIDRLERATVLRDGWHLVGTTDELAKPGDFRTVELLGTPLLIRNCDGQLRAFLNVCAHRHCLLTSQPAGYTARLRCQYHGWEYDEQGIAAKIPSPRQFAPLERGEFRLHEQRLACCGQLVFVSLADDGSALDEQLGPIYELIAERFGAEWSPQLKREWNYEANWKAVIENSLEAYHVPSVHPQTFRVDPGEERSTHVIDDHYTSLSVDLPFHAHSRVDLWFQAAEGWFVRQFGVTPSKRYSQHHVFPNLLFSFTDAVSLCQTVLPRSAVTSRGIVRQFGRSGLGRSWPKRVLAQVGGRIAARITHTVLDEDQRLFGELQRGLMASRQKGVLGRCEERLHAFQAYLAHQHTLKNRDDLSSTDLSSTDLSSTDLSSTDLSSTDLSRAELTGGECRHEDCHD